MSEDLSRLWTPESTLRLRDTSGRTTGLRQCLGCGREFDPEHAPDPGSAFCGACGHSAPRDEAGDVKGLARCRDPEGTRRCLLCAKLFPAHALVPSDQICGDCRGTYKEAAVLRCAKCNVTICRLAPKVLDNGFVIRPNQILHSDACNICRPGIEESKIVEITLWMKTQRPKTTVSTPSSVTALRKRERS